MRAEIKTLQLNEAFNIAHGTSSSRQVLRLYSDQAVGEAPFVPYYNEDPQKTLQWIKTLPVSHGAEHETGQAPAAGKLALDILKHDKLSQAQGISLGQFLGIPKGPTPPACRSFSIPSDLGEFREKVKTRSQTFRVLKLKLGSGDLDFDEKIVATAREAAPQAKIFVDVNGGWSVSESVRMIPRLVPYSLTLIEQPFHHRHGVEGWKEFRNQMPITAVPLFADESVQNAQDVQKFSAYVDGTNVKLLKCGSLHAALEMIKKSKSFNLKVLLGCMIESSIGITAAAHLAPLVDWIDLDGHLYVANNDYEGATFSNKGELLMPEGAGLGVKALIGAE